MLPLVVLVGLAPGVARALPSLSLGIHRPELPEAPEVETPEAPGEAACAVATLGVPEAIRQAALRLQRLGLLRRVHLPVDAVNPCEAGRVVGELPMLELAVADELLDRVRSFPPPPRLSAPAEAVPPAPRPRRQRPTLPIAAAFEVRLVPAELDAIGAWQRGLGAERSLLKGLAGLRLSPAPNMMGMRVEASYRADRLPLALSARYLQMVPALTPSVVAVGELGFGLRWVARYLTVQLDYGHTWLGNSVASGSNVTMAMLSFPLL